MKKTILSLLILCSLGVDAQKLIPFTAQLRADLEIKSVNISKIQFYIKVPVTIKRSGKEEKATTEEGGKIVVNNSSFREIVTFKSTNLIKPQLMGVCCDKGNKDYLGICFEEGSPAMKRVIFYRNNQTGEYMLHEPDGFMRYDNQSYEVTEGQNAILYVTKKSVSKYSVIKKNVKGVKVG